ncbi:MAG: tryptophan 7-halogenase [Holophagales bacterium]|nr:MAG: tryptophan 7-halogenase [Holophagales bacterium]
MSRIDVDVAIVGGGLAGLSLARQLLLQTDRTVLVLDRAAELPPRRQKVGEATVQVSGYYFSKVLELEEYLLREHYMKYNLRFLWKSAGTPADAFEQFSQSYLRPLSNVASYQLDRNKIEAELLRRNREDPRCQVIHPASDVQVELAADDEPHRLRFRVDGEPREAAARWVVDASGRGRLLATKLGLAERGEIRHGSSFLWVDGLLDIEKLTGRSAREIRLAPERRALGHLPFFLATNHFMGEGWWVWVIPLQGKTSIGLVYDRALFDSTTVSTAEKLVAWICRELPLFARDLPQREVLDFWGYRDFGHTSAQTLSARRWAVVGEAGRFSDPLYSPGGDLISIYNTLVRAAIELDDAAELERRVPLYERAMRAIYDAYVPSYAVSYAVLADPETYSLRYVWELTIYFAFYVFPFVNDLHPEPRFLPAFLALFAQLGPMNRRLHEYFAAFWAWRKEHLPPAPGPVFFDFMSLAPLKRAEMLFYRVGIEPREALGDLVRSLDDLRELAQFILVHLASRVAGDPSLVHRRAFVEAFDPRRAAFDPAEILALAAHAAGDPEVWSWSLDPQVLAAFAAKEPMAGGEEMATATVVEGRG